MMPKFTMNVSCRWMMLFISLWIQVGFVPGIHCKDGTVNHLTREDVLLLKDEKDPKCFTRTGWDFTCFFETADNRTYDLLYTLDGPLKESRCVQRPEEGMFLHICVFPSEDVYMYEQTQLEVVEHSTNTRVYRRNVSVEDHFLLDAPYSVSLNQNGQAGQLLVSWQTKIPTYCVDVMNRIRYSSQGLGEKTKEKKMSKNTRDILDSLVRGEETEVQVTVKCAPSESAGHWSSWSSPVRAMVPQSADDISLMCYTSDLQNITCQWNGSRYGVEKVYKLFYKIGLSEEWTECLTNGTFTDLCHFRGDESKKIRVKLSSTPAPLSRTFYTQAFTLNKIIKTSPPSHLRGTLKKYKLCLKWEAPLPSLSAHLQYEVGCQTREGEAWLTVSLEGPETGTCIGVSTGKQYNFKVRAKPIGSIYSGHWSDWSDVVTGYNHTDLGMLPLLCIPATLMVTALFIYMYFRKLKQYFWPPVPNLDKVLQVFLTEINRQKWDPPLTTKQCCEETTASVVEIMSEDEVSGLGKQLEEFTQLLSPEGSLSSGEQVDGSPGTSVFPDYVTLNKDSTIVCPNGNKYMYETVGEKGVPGVGDDLQTFQCCCTDGSVCVPPCLGSDFLNHSYVPLAEAADRCDYRVTPARGPGNLYTNLPCS
ncbi:thrombopoietin receptor isoform X2 [Trachinotus anak]|uniref:thrombopoietin receptor isoform X2 n=1 Tax=Trachinotus anak TaxID=443729 RepID=UPI0039F1F8D2